MGDLDTLPVRSADLSIGASYDTLQDAFLRLSAAEIYGRLQTVAEQLERGRTPSGGVPYRHVNGFTKIVIAEFVCGARLTLHYWPATPGIVEDISRPHDHRFPFLSILLGGRQRFAELKEGPQGDRSPGWRRFAYRPILGGRLAKIDHSCDTELSEFREVEREPLMGHYATSAEVVHRAITRRDTACATLVLRGPRERKSSHVYYRPDEPPPRGGIQLGRRLRRDDVIQQVRVAMAMIDRT